MKIVPFKVFKHIILIEGKNLLSKIFLGESSYVHCN